MGLVFKQVIIFHCSVQLPGTENKARLTAYVAPRKPKSESVTTKKCCKVLMMIATLVWVGAVEKSGCTFSVAGGKKVAAAAVITFT